MGRLLLSPAGRIGRSSFVFGLCIIAAAAALVAVGFAHTSGARTISSFSSGVAPGLIVTVLFFWPLTAVVIKRLHDLGLTGKLFPLGLVGAGLLSSLLSVPFKAVASSQLMNPENLATMGLLGLGALLLTLVPGQRSPNVYGVQSARLFEIP